MYYLFRCFHMKRPEIFLSFQMKMRMISIQMCIRDSYMKDYKKRKDTLSNKEQDVFKDMRIVQEMAPCAFHFGISSFSRLI